MSKRSAPNATTPQKTKKKKTCDVQKPMTNLIVKQRKPPSLALIMKQAANAAEEQENRRIERELNCRPELAMLFNWNRDDVERTTTMEIVAQLPKEADNKPRLNLLCKSSAKNASILEVSKEGPKKPRWRW
ncbi:uncharacterized protein LOC132796344 [Drosophila nasuta]|uniref:uncharacterized protein LOC132796344 n=1 Tax=Drosophila nasuta TaxID=42062 RepID=UPI00295F57D8|nr:uncharacterized protein LOC132796344 [Drosophila nasuta]